MNKDWVVKAAFKRDGNKNATWFTGSQDTSIPRGTKGFYKLKFKPEWIDDAECELQLKILQTNDIFNYMLKGVGEEPLACAHKIIECSARKICRDSIMVENTSNKDILYHVQSDIPQFFGPESLRIKKKSTEEYKFAI